MSRARKPTSDNNPYHVQARHLRDVAMAMERVQASFKELDAQNKTIIIRLNQVESQLERLGNSIEDKIGQRIEKLRQELRKVIEIFVVRDDNTGDANKIIRDHMINRPERKKE